MPFSARNGQLKFIDALFMSTSAVCVTGLTVINVGRDLSLSGQVITLLLFQLGGIGIVTFSAFLFGLLGRSLSFKGRDIIQSTLLPYPQRKFLDILKWVMISTLSFESAGTLLLYFRFSRQFPPARALFYALYHAVSAFNNCGYSLFSKNLVAYSADVLVNIVIMLLIIMGGLGFLVQYELFKYIRGSLRRLSLHSKLVLITTLGLIIGGALLFLLFESNKALQGVPWGERLLVSFFQSITPRTCGFNTVNIACLSNATILMMIMLMFVGASPGSTGGGVKTTSFALLLLMIRHRLAGREEITVLRRTVPRETINRTLAIVLAAAISVFIVFSALILLPGGTGDFALDRPLFVEYLFETVSAFGTVGLSMGITAALTVLQKLALVLLMYAGRVGPLTLAISLALPKNGVVYAEEAVMVG